MMLGGGFCRRGGPQTSSGRGGDRQVHARLAGGPDVATRRGHAARLLSRLVREAMATAASRGSSLPAGVHRGVNPLPAPGAGHWDRCKGVAPVREWIA